MWTGCNWMGALDDHKSLSQFSIPGAHNSGALHEPFHGTSQCQHLAVSEQLAAGVRYLDVRCRHVDDAFAIHHGPISQKITFADVIDICTKFLAGNPSECIVMSVKEESVPSHNTRTFEETFNSYVENDPQRWLLGADVPILKDAQGKIVLLRQFPTRKLPKGLDATSWPVNSTFTIDGPAKLRVQDNYIVPDNLGKLTAIQSFYSEAASAIGDILYLNFTSGYRRGALGIPDIRIVSEYINPAVSQYFSANRRGRFGISVTDFVNEALCALIVATNHA